MKENSTSSGRVYLAINDGIQGDYFLIEHNSVEAARFAARDDTDTAYGSATWKILLEVDSGGEE